MTRDRITLIILSIIAIFCLVTTTPYHEWGDDFAMYLMHAENIAHSEAYSKTGYIFNELAPTYAPADYSPGFPIVMVPAVLLFGNDFFALKVYLIIYFIIFLLVTYVFLKDKIDIKYIWAILLILGFSPFILVQRDSVLSDIVGGAFMVIAILATQKALISNRIWQWLLVAFLYFFAFSIRSTAIVLIPAVFLHVFIHDRASLLKVAGVALVFILLIACQQLIFRQHANYFEMFVESYAERSVSEIVAGWGLYAQQYFFAFSDLFIGNYHNIVTNTIVFIAGFVLFLIGWSYTFYKKHTYLEWIVIGYWALVILWPGWQGLRYFIPLLPLYFYYWVIGFQLMFSNRLQPVVSIIFAVLIFVSMASAYAGLKPRDNQYGITAQNSMALFEYLVENTHAEDVIMSPKPRALAYMTDRPGLVYPDKEYRDSLYSCIGEHQVRFLVVQPYGNVPAYNQDLVRTNTQAFSLVYANPDWEVYKVN